MLPRTITLEKIGDLTYNDRFRRFETSVDLNDVEFVGDISIDVDSHTDLNLAKTRLVLAVKLLGTLIELSKAAAVEALHDTYNRVWRGDNIRLSESAFVNRLNADSLWVDEDNAIGMSFSTDDMFPGHAIRVDFDESLAHGTASLW